MVCPHYPWGVSDTTSTRDFLGPAPFRILFAGIFFPCNVFFGVPAGLVAGAFLRGPLFGGMASLSLSQLVILGAKASWNFELT
jgi:hypothetical protein